MLSPQHFHESPASYIIPKTFKTFEILRLNLKSPENEFTYLLQTVFSVCGGELKSSDFLFLPPSLGMHLFVCLLTIDKN